MKKVYPGIFHNEGGNYWVEFPDLVGCSTGGGTLEEVIGLAEEALDIYLSTLSEEGKSFPAATEIDDVPKPEDGFVNYVVGDTEKYRRDNRAVRKTLSLPKWLSDEATKRQISLSKVLQDGLKKQMGL